MKNIESLLDLAGQHVKKIEANKADATACLADDILRSQLDDHDDTTSFESILGMFFNPSEDRLSIRVSCAAFSLSLHTLVSATTNFSTRITGLKFSNVMCAQNFFKSSDIRKSSSWKHGFDTVVGPVLLDSIPLLIRQQFSTRSSKR